MAICNLSELSFLIKSGQCLLGLDHGSVIIGVAIADPNGIIASPLGKIKKSKFKNVASTLSDIIKERNIGGLILGLPKNMDGTEGASAQSARTFASNLLKNGNLPVDDIPIAFWDERMSTAAVTRFMLEDDMTRSRRINKVDQAAAAYILQGALDAMQKIKKDNECEKK